MVSAVSRARWLLVCFVLTAATEAVLTTGVRTGSSRPPRAAEGIHKIKHLVVVMQENRSFDEYFGTFPGAEGFPAGVCVPNPATGGCDEPFHDSTDLDRGGPHAAQSFVADLDGGKMDGFVAQAQARVRCARTNSPNR